jgi:hypothetical protein
LDPVPDPDPYPHTHSDFRLDLKPVPQKRMGIYNTNLLYNFSPSSSFYMPKYGSEDINYYENEA